MRKLSIVFHEVFSALPGKLRHKVRSGDSRFLAGSALLLFGLASTPVLADSDLLRFKPAVQNGVVLTARSLMLNQEVSITRLESALYADLPWSYGTLVEALALSPSDLEALSGRRVLDLGGGASLLGDELVTAFGADTVTVVDLNQEVYNRRMAARSTFDQSLTNRKAVGVIYQENIDKLGHILRDVVGEAEWIETHRLLESKAAATADSYFNNPKVIRLAGDATDLPASLKTNGFDLVVSSWVLMYLNEDQRKNLIEEAIRVTKPGGQIRFKGGSESADGGSPTGWKANPDGSVDAVSADRFRAWYGAWLVESAGSERFHFPDLGTVAKGGKTVAISPESEKSLLVLDVLP